LQTVHHTTFVMKYHTRCRCVDKLCLS